MSLRTKSILCLVTILAIYMACDIYIYQKRILPGFVELEQAQALQNYDRCVKAIDRERHHLETTCLDWAWWTETWQYVQGENDEFQAANLVTDTYDIIHLVAFYIYDSKGQKVWGNGYSPDAEEYVVAADFEPPLTDSIGTFLSSVNEAEAASGWLQTSLGPVLIAGGVILDSEQKGGAQGHVLMARAIDQHFAENLSSQTDLGVSFEPISDPSEPTTETTIELLDEETMRVTGYYPDITGSVYLRVQATMPRTIVPAGTQVVNQSIRSDIMVGALLTLCLILLLELLVLRPITRLSQEMEQIEDSGDHSQRLKQQGGGEIRTLTTNINDMLAGLEAGDQVRQRLESELWQSRKRESLDAMARSIAHSFNNILTSILGYQELLATRISKDTKEGKWLAASREGTERATKLSTLMLSYVGFNTTVHEAGDINQACREQLAEMAALLPEGISTELALADDLPDIPLDVEKFKQVIANIVTNAIEALGDDDKPGVITIRTGKMTQTKALDSTWQFEGPQHENYIQIDITDTGSGMDEADRSRAFDPFFSTKHVGRGLGLATVIGFIRNHQGATRIESTKGQGTCVSLLLPTQSR